MQAKDMHLLRFLEQGSFSFVIPVYQRNYDWSLEQCNQLIHDLEVIIESGLKSYFLGSLVYISEAQSVSLSSVNKILIIDGQQRITTITLLLIAIANKIESEKLKGTIFDKYILNDLADGEEKIKLKPIKDDLTALSAVVKDDDLVKGSSVSTNYQNFLQYLDKSKYSPEEIFDAIGKLKVVDISLEVGLDNPQLIFESLNSTGLDLSAADLIRNFVLMNHSLEAQNDLYEKYWRKIEKLCNFKTDDFIRHFITMKEGYIPNKSKIYSAFKSYRFKQKEMSVEKILQELLEFATFYNQFEMAQHGNQEIRVLLSRLKRLENSVTYPFLLDMFHQHVQEKISSAQVVEALRILESYIVRRFICDAPTNAMNKIFMTLSKDIKKLGEDWNENYIAYLSYVLGSKKSSGRFPKEKEVQEALLSKNIYNMKAKNKLFLLESIENFKNKERVDIFSGVDKGDISIEHIMPQKLTKDWKISLGSDWERVHEQYLHTIGNLSLTGYNSALKNKPFKEKVAIGFNESRFWLNSFLKKQENWTEQTILKRTNLIAERFLKIWVDLDVKEEISRVLDEEVLLSEEFKFTNCQIKGAQVNNDAYEVSSFRDLKISILRSLYSKGSHRLYQIQEMGLVNKVIITTAAEDLRVPLEFAPGVYTEGYQSAQGIIKTLKKILPNFGIKLDQVKIILQGDGKKKIKHAEEEEEEVAA